MSWGMESYDELNNSNIFDVQPRNYLKTVDLFYTGPAGRSRTIIIPSDEYQGKLVAVPFSPQYPRGLNKIAISGNVITYSIYSAVQVAGKYAGLRLLIFSWRD